MQSLIDLIQTIHITQALPFSIYTSTKEQYLLNVPVVKPLFIAVLGGKKQLGKNDEINCQSGNFIFLSDSPSINMRNIPKGEDYLALLIEFDYQDFEGLDTSAINKEKYCIGDISIEVTKCLEQFVDFGSWAPKALWSHRRKELINLLCQLGYSNILSMAANPKVGHKLHSIIAQNPSNDMSMPNICAQLAMSESTLRRKLKQEGTSIQDIKDQVKLGSGLHLLQTTLEPIGLIAQTCGYHSQSRFTDRFKARFGLTPSQLRKTKMTD